MAAPPPVPTRPAASPPFPVRFGLVFGLAALHWPLAFALYLPSGLLSLITAAPVLLGARQWPNLGPWLASLTNGGNLDGWLNAAGGRAGRLLPQLAAEDLLGTQPGELRIG